MNETDLLVWVIYLVVVIGHDRGYHIDCNARLHGSHRLDTLNLSRYHGTGYVGFDNVPGNPVG